MGGRLLLLPVLLASVALNGQQRADIRVDVGLVTVTCSVTDRAGVPIKNLGAEDFVLRDNGKRQKIEQFWQESELPLTVGLIVDVSGSQAAFVKRHRQTVAQFLTQVLGPKDRAFLVTIGPDVRLIGDLTGSGEELRKSVDLIDAYQTHGVQLGEPCSRTDPIGACGGTALWNGVYAAASQKLHWVQGRKALIILSDGLDTGSIHSLSDAIESAQEAETVVYAIKYVDPALTPAEAGVSKRMAAVRGLERLTELTGGDTFPNPDDDLDMVFTRIEDDLRNLYVLAFTPPVAARDGRFHKLEVTLARKDLKDLPVRARNGYYAQERR